MELYCFTSDLNRLYRAAAVEALATARHHLLTFRYNEDQVDPEVQNWPVGSDGSVTQPSGRLSGFIVYAHVVGNDFAFFPLRSLSLHKIWKRGHTYYLALSVENYVDYGAPAAPLDFTPPFQALQNRPNVDPANSKRGIGSFLMARQTGLVPISAPYVGQNAEDAHWQHTCEVLYHSADFKDSLFYRHRGIYRIGRESLAEWTCFKATETLVHPDPLVSESRYVLKMGTNYVLKILFYMPVLVVAEKIEISCTNDDAAIITPNEIEVKNRYNEERILIGCKRLIERALIPLCIRNAEEVTDAVQGPRPLQIVPLKILIQVVAPAAIVWSIVVLLMVAALSLSMGPDSIKGASNLLKLAKPPDETVALWAGICKAIGAIATLAAGYLAFRKLPVGK